MDMPLEKNSAAMNVTLLSYRSIHGVAASCLMVAKRNLEPRMRTQPLGVWRACAGSRRTFAVVRLQCRWALRRISADFWLGVPEFVAAVADYAFGVQDAMNGECLVGRRRATPMPVVRTTSTATEEAESVDVRR